MLSSLVRAGWSFIRSPARAARENRQPRLDFDCLWLYVLATFAFMLLFWLKPFDFPDRTAAVPYEMQNFAYWLKAELWQPVLMAGWIVFMLGLIRFFSSGSWPVRLACAVFLAASPFIVIASYAQLHAFPYWGFVLGCLAWLAPFYFLTAKAGKDQWWPLINFSLGVNAIGLPISGLLGFSVMLNQPELFKALQICGGLWLLGATITGVRELTGLRLPRAFMAVFLSMILQIALAFSLHFLGAKGVLKALFYG